MCLIVTLSSREKCLLVTLLIKKVSSAYPVEMTGQVRSGKTSKKKPGQSRVMIYLNVGTTNSNLCKNCTSCLFYKFASKET